MKFYLVQNRKCFLHRVKRHPYDRRSSTGNVILRVSLFPNITPLLSWPNTSMDEQTQQQFLTIKEAFEKLWWTPEQIKCEVSKDICLHVTIEGRRILIGVHGRILDHLYSVCGEGGTMKVVATRIPDIKDGVVLSAPDMETVFATREMDVTLALGQALPSPFITGDCNGIGVAHCTDECAEVDDQLTQQWNTGLMHQAYGLGITLNITFTTKNSKTPAPKNVNVDICKQILDTQIHTDLSIQANNGVELKCHKCFLAAHSPVLAAMLESDLQECQTNTIQMIDMTEQGVASFLEYLYTLHTTSAEENPFIALELLEAAHKYDINHLESTMKQIFLEKNPEWYSVDVALHLFLFARRIEECENLKAKCVQVLKGQRNEMVSSEVYKQLFQKDPAAGMELCSASFFM